MKTQTKPELDLEMMQRLYEFGALNAYEIVWFNPLSLNLVTDFITFNQDIAERALSQWKERGYTAGMRTYHIRFDGAFAKKGKA